MEDVRNLTRICPICGKMFENYKSLYSHINRSKGNHSRLRNEIGADWLTLTEEQYNSSCDIIANLKAKLFKELEELPSEEAIAILRKEALADKYEADNIKSPHTYRFCPGYQNTSVEDLREIFKIIKPFKLGISLLDSNLMIPLKTMCGIIALGKTSKKECGHCAIKDKCEYRKKGKTCF